MSNKLASAALMISLATAGALGYAQNNRSADAPPEKPFSCLVAGDGIALALGSVLTECVTHAAKGAHIKDVTLPGTTTTVIIALGDVDRSSPTLLADVRALRTKAGSRRVIWVVPKNPGVRGAISDIAKGYGDHTVETAEQARKVYR